MTFLKTILANLRETSGKAMLVEMHKDQRVSSLGGDLLHRSAQVVAYLKNAGVQPGDRVALLAPNSACWVACDLAILSSGAICVPLYARQAPDELAVMLGDCEPVLLIAADDTLREAIGKAWKNAPALATFDEVFATEVDTVDFDVHEAAGDDPMTIIYTSGTSGEPKGVVYSWDNVDFMVPVCARELNTMGGERSGDDKVFHYLPFCFAGSRIVLWTTLYRGNPLMMSTDLLQLKEELQAADPNYYLNVPTLLERIRRGVNDMLEKRGGVVCGLYRRGERAFSRTLAGDAGWGDRLALAVAGRMIFPTIKKRIGASLEFLICGSAPLSEETQRWFEMIGIPVYQVYGLTETTAIVTMDQPGEARSGFVGKSIEGIELQITDDGELICKGPNVCGGYWNQPEATQEVIRDGWFYTGDQFEVDERGNWRIIGRVKNLLVPESGHNVAPEPIEQAILESSERIEQAIVIGHGRPFLSAIVTGDISDEDVANALAQINDELPHYRRIRKHVLAGELFTPENGLLTANQKMRRKVIEQHFSSQIEGMYQ
jgi:long-chain acyl-CoA synthetase